jgi:glycosyltransferase involved in cell wall biosynthesis
MKILTAMYTLRKGGSYDRFLMMLEAFLERGWEVHCLSLTPIHIKHLFYHNHVIVLPFRLRDGLTVKFIVLLLLPIYSLLIGWREKIDLYVAFGPLYAFIESIPKWILKKQMVTLIRLDLDLSLGFKMQDLFNYSIWFNKIIEYVGLIFSDRIVTTNMATREDITRIFGSRKEGKVEVLFNNILPMMKSTSEGVDHMRAQFRISKEANILVTAGVLTPRKNIEILIKSLPKIEMKNLYLLIVGDSLKEADFHYRDSLQGLAKRLRVDKQVVFTGWLEKEDLWKIYLASDLFVLPSLNEGMPNVLLEALGCGIPCIGSDIPGIRDILCHEVLMFDPLDEKAIADKVRRFFSDFQYSNYIISLCQERKKAFVFDWKERVFQMVTQRPFHRGEACQSR